MLRTSILRRWIAVAALGCTACAGVPVPATWSFRSDGVPVETERAQFHAAPPAVQAAVEQELVKRGFTLAAAEGPYAIVANERTDCSGAPDTKLAFEWNGHCSLSGDTPICRRRGVAVSLAADADGTSARIFVRSLAWKDGDALSASVDETFKGCIPKEEGEPRRVEALVLGAGQPAHTVLESVREQIPGVSSPLPK